MWFKRLPTAERVRYRLIRGHFHFGLHRLIPGRSVYITLLRHPVERVHSFYYYARTKPDHYLYNFLRSGCLNPKSPVVQDLTSELCNEQTRLLAGGEWEDPRRPITRAALKSAQTNLRTHFSVIGLTEEFDASVLLLHQLFGWQLPVYRKENVTKNKPESSSLDPETRRLIEQTNSFDLELYDYARELFAEKRQDGQITGAELQLVSR
jgi:hypothetical protein